MVPILAGVLPAVQRAPSRASRVEEFGSAELRRRRSPKAFEDDIPARPS